MQFAPYGTRFELSVPHRHVGHSAAINNKLATNLAPSKFCSVCELYYGILTKEIYLYHLSFELNIARQKSNQCAKILLLNVILILKMLYPFHKYGHFCI